MTLRRQKYYFLVGNNPSCTSHLPLLTAMFKAERTADQAAPRAVGTRGSSACVGAMQSSSALGTDTGCPSGALEKCLSNQGWRNSHEHGPTSNYLSNKTLIHVHKSPPKTLSLAASRHITPVRFICSCPAGGKAHRQVHQAEKLESSEFCSFNQNQSHHYLRGAPDTFSLPLSLKHSHLCSRW